MDESYTISLTPRQGRALSNVVEAHWVEPRAKSLGGRYRGSSLDPPSQSAVDRFLLRLDESEAIDDLLALVAHDPWGVRESLTFLVIDYYDPELPLGPGAGRVPHSARAVQRFASALPASSRTLYELTKWEESP